MFFFFFCVVTLGLTGPDHVRLCGIASASGERPHAGASDRNGSHRDSGGGQVLWFPGLVDAGLAE